VEIGRRIYYNKATGAFVYDTGERSGDVVETTPEQDFASYPQLQGRSLADTGYIELAYGARREEFFNMGSLEVNPATQELIIYPRLTMQADRNEIPADGVTAAVLTAALPAPLGGETVVFTREGGQDYQVQTVDGVASLEFATVVPGEFMIWARHPKYGAAAMLIKGVAV